MIQGVNPNTPVEYIELALTTGNAKKDEDTNFRVRVFSPTNEPIAYTHWIGTNGGTTGEWFGSGCTYYPGPNLPNWCNDFDTWRATHPNAQMTLQLLVGARLEIQIGAMPQTDHWQVKATVFAKLQGSPSLVPISSDPNGFTGIASDGEHGWPTTLVVPFDLLTAPGV